MNILEYDTEVGINRMRWSVRWTIIVGDKKFEKVELFEFHMLAIAKQLQLQEIGIDAIIECAR